MLFPSTHTQIQNHENTDNYKYFILIFIWRFLCSGLCLVAALLISSILKEDTAVLYRWERVRNSGTRTKDSLTSKCV